MQMEEAQLGSAATSSGRAGTDDTTSLERVETSPFVAAGDRMPTHLNSSFSTACPGDPQAKPQSSNVPVGGSSTETLLKKQ